MARGGASGSSVSGIPRRRGGAYSRFSSPSAAPRHDLDRGTSKGIRRTPNTKCAAVQNVGVDHRRANVSVAQELLDGSNVGSGLQQMRRERVAQRVAARALRDARNVDRRLERALNHRVVQVMPAPYAAGVRKRPACGKDVLPSPIGRSARRLTQEAVGNSGGLHLDTAIADTLASPCLEVPRRAEMHDTGRGARRSLPPLPSRITISRRSTSTSLIRSVTHSVSADRRRTSTARTAEWARPIAVEARAPGLDLELPGPAVTVSPARCRRCGEVAS